MALRAAYMSAAATPAVRAVAACGATGDRTSGPAHRRNKRRIAAIRAGRIQRSL
jgi:hypothetical protein